MISDEGQNRAAYTMLEASHNNLRAATAIDEAVKRLVPLLGEGYGNQLSQLIETLNQLVTKLP